jgi:hypothetical protein
MLPTARRTVKILTAAAVIPASLLIAGTAMAATAAPAGPGAVQHHPAPRFAVRQILFGSKLRHAFVPAGSAGRRSEPLAQPDDITVLGRDLFTGFQNGVGPQASPAPTATATAPWSSSRRAAGSSGSGTSGASATA